MLPKPKTRKKIDEKEAVKIARRVRESLKKEARYLRDRGNANGRNNIFTETSCFT